jgi:UDP-N-acetylmuramate dehydrogenase
MINIEECFSLKSFNTFGIEATARYFAETDNREDLRTVINVFRDNPLPKLIMGGGSNLLFLDNFQGVVIYPDIKGCELVRQNDDYVWIKACAGENWDKFVELCVSRNWGGVENLSLIPGNVGACPIQNIGAYGVEVKDVIDSVEAMSLETGDIHIFSNAECKFGYRDSIFKNEWKNRYIVVSVTFRLARNPVLNKEYKDVLEELKKSDAVNIATIREAIINIRRRKLPDPKDYGNAGSFYKNPVINRKQFEEIKNAYSDVPSYSVNEEEVKIPAAWLIQTAGWKGVREGNTGTHPTQPLVIINYGGAKGLEIFDFAKKIQQSIIDKFGIELEMEVRIC